MLCSFFVTSIYINGISDIDFKPFKGAVAEAQQHYARLRSEGRFRCFDDSKSTGPQQRIVLGCMEKMSGMSQRNGKEQLLKGIPVHRILTAFRIVHVLCLLHVWSAFSQVLKALQWWMTTIAIAKMVAMNPAPLRVQACVAIPNLDILEHKWRHDMIGAGLSSSEFACNWEKGLIHVFVKRCMMGMNTSLLELHINRRWTLCTPVLRKRWPVWLLCGPGTPRRVPTCILDWTNHPCMPGFSALNQPVRTNGAAMPTALTAAMSWRPPQQSLRRRLWRAVASGRPALARGEGWKVVQHLVIQCRKHLWSFLHLATQPYSPVIFGT